MRFSPGRLAITPKALTLSCALVVGVAILLTAGHWLVGTAGLFQAGTKKQQTASFPAGGSPSRGLATTATAAYEGLPLYFEANEGQVEPRVEFLSRGRGHTLFLRQDEAVVSLRDSWVRMKFVGANRDPEISGLDPLPGVTHYLIGNDRAEWHTQVPHYAGAHYEALYPGIDLIFYGNEGRLEFDFVVGSGVDPGQICLGLEGTSQLTLTDSGDLVLVLAGSDERVAASTSETGQEPTLAEITLRAPTIYQEIHGERRLVEGGYSLQGDSEVGFWIGAYDESVALVVDPVLAFSTYLGGPQGDDAEAIAVDGDGNAYIVGTYDPGGAPIPPLAAEHAPGLTDVFVAKIDVSRATLVYTTSIGTADGEWGKGITVDGQGHAYITGATESSDWPTVNPVQPTFAGGDGDAFIAKLSRDGSALLYSTYLGGSTADSGTGIAVDAAGSAYVTGYADSSNFPTSNAMQPGSGGSGDAFVAKLSPTGSALVYSTYLGGSGSETGQGIDLDGSGNTYVAGGTESTDFPTANPYSSALAQGDQHAFAAKLSASGSTLVYSTYLGGSSRDQAHGIAVNRIGNAYLVGRTTSTNFPTTSGAPQNAPGGGGDDAFVTKLATSGSSLVFSTYVGGGGVDAGNGIAIDDVGNVFITGFTASTNFPTLRPYQGTFGGIDDAFVTALTSTGQGRYSTFLGGTDGEMAQGIALDRRGNVYITGWTDGTDFPTAMPYDGSSNGTRDAFISKLVMPLDFWVASAGRQ